MTIAALEAYVEERTQACEGESAVILAAAARDHANPALTVPEKERLAWNRGHQVALADALLMAHASPGDLNPAGLARVDQVAGRKLREARELHAASKGIRPCP